MENININVKTITFYTHSEQVVDARIRENINPFDKNLHPQL
jgi:hypothetical protein